MKTYKLKIKKVEGEVVATSNAEYYKIYCIEKNRYYEHEDKLFILSYGDSDLLSPPIEQKFDISKKMEEDGYFYKSVYEDGIGVCETPFARIETRIINEHLDTVTSDGMCIGNIEVTVIIK
jgi:hypothetical protein